MKVKKYSLQTKTIQFWLTFQLLDVVLMKMQSLTNIASMNFIGRRKKETRRVRIYSSWKQSKDRRGTKEISKSKLISLVHFKIYLDTWNRECTLLSLFINFTSVTYSEFHFFLGRRTFTYNWGTEDNRRAKAKDA